MSDLEAAVEAIESGELIVYPTETVYGLGADALDPEAVTRVFEAKGRSRDEPISMAVPDLNTAIEYAAPTATERTFMHEFLPGPVTVLTERREMVPDVLTAGREQVGIRVPDHPLALELLERVAPITATSANVSGKSSACQVPSLDSISDDAAVVLDGGETGGTGSTVVDVEAGEIYRRGPDADAIETWLESR